MGNLRFVFRSTTLQMDTGVTIILPTNYNWKDRKAYVPGERFQTLYLLHGGGEDDTGWLRRTRIEEYAEKNQLMVVCPATQGGMFMNTAYNARYEDFMTTELMEIVRTFFPAALDRENSFIAGQGMGAGGALSLAIKHPDLYSVCVSLTPGIGAELDQKRLEEQVKVMPQMKNVYGTSPEFLEKNNLYRIAKENMEKHVPLPKYYINTDDMDMPATVEAAERQAKILKELGYDVYFDKTLGPGHDRNYCDKQIRRAIECWLPLTKNPIYPNA